MNVEVEKVTFQNNWVKYVFQSAYDDTVSCKNGDLFVPSIQ